MQNATPTYTMVDFRNGINRVAPKERLVQHLNDRLILSRHV